MFFSIYFRKNENGSNNDPRRTTQTHQTGEVAGI